MNVTKTKLPYHFVYAGMIAYSLTSCATSYAPRLSAVQEPSLQTIEQHITQEKDDVQVVLRYEGAADNMLGFSMEITNYSEKPIEIDPTRFYGMYYGGSTPAKPVVIRAINPEQKIAEIDRRIQSRIEGGEAGRTLLIILGVVLIIGIIAIAVSESSNNKKSESSSSNNNTPRNSSIAQGNTNTYSRQGACSNRATHFDDSALMTTLQFIGRTAELTATGAINSKIKQENAVERLRYMRSIWENETIRKVTLYTNERLRGTVFYPNQLKNAGTLRLNFPITQFEHQFSFNQY